MEQAIEKRKKYRKRKRSPGRRFYSPSYKIKTVKLHLEGGVPLSVITEESGVCNSILSKWCRSFKQHGEEAFKERVYSGRPQMSPVVKEKIAELKRDAPESGIRRISQTLRRIFFLPGSPETVRQTLHATGQLTGKKAAPKEKNVEKPRRFERSTPNQMWQSDITMFRLAGTQVYLIGYIDDYSRFMVGAGLYATQKASQVLEVYRQAVVEYGAPREMLTDNGRQYVSWRGKTQFEAQMKKDHVQHIKSQPHHPMTLGKIERFWETIFQEFLSKAQFNSFEDARDRIGLWVKFYNHRRPHQGIGGMCPADRYFEVATELKKVIERGVKENVLELALKGKVTAPFYMVGRMRGESVVLTAEKGKLKLRVDGTEATEGKEVVYDIAENNINTGGVHGQGESSSQSIEIGDARRDNAVQGGAVGMDSLPEAVGGVPGTGAQVDDVQPLAEASNVGDAAGAGAAGESGERSGTLTEAAPATGERGTAYAVAVVGSGGSQAVEPVTAGAGIEISRKEEGSIVGSESLKRKDLCGTITGERSEGPSACPGDMGCTEREADSNRGSGSAGNIPSELLRMGAPGAGGNDGGTAGPGSWPATFTSTRYGEGGAQKAACRTGTGSENPSADSDGTGDALASYELAENY
jgi:transposase InsO family protein